MTRLPSPKTLLAAAIVTAGLICFGNASAEAGCSRRVAYRNFAPVCTYKTVIDYELQPVEYIAYETRYMPCGRPYTVQVVRTKWVKVPVERLVKVCY